MSVNVITGFTASLDIDPQQGFSELCPTELPVPGALEIVPELLKHHKMVSITIVSRDIHPPGAIWETQNSEEIAEPLDFPEVDAKWSPHCIAGTRGAQLLPGLPLVREYNYQINKGMDTDAHPYGALFHDKAQRKSTGLLEILKYHHINTVLVGGLALDICVLATINQLLDNQLKIILNLAATRSAVPEKTLPLVKKLLLQGVTIVENATQLQAVKHSTGKII